MASLETSVFHLNVRYIQKERPISALSRTEIDPLQNESMRKENLYLRSTGVNPLISPLQSLGAPGMVGERWELLSRELQQKQDLIHRLMKENDEKSDSLKLTGAEIIDLRRQIKLLHAKIPL